MKFKKVLSLLLAAAMLISLLSACGGGAKEDASSEEAPAQEETVPEESAPEETPAAEGPSGHYILTEVSEDGETYGPDLIAYFGGESYIDMNDDGTFTFYLTLEELMFDGTWTDSVLSVEGGELPYTYDADAMTISINDEEDGLDLVFTHESVAPEIEYIVMDDGDAGEVDVDDGYDEAPSGEDADDDGYFLYNFSIPETVVYDEGGVTVTLTGVEADDWGDYDLQYTVTNSTEKNILVSSSNLAINGCIIDDYMYCDVSAGKNASGYVGIDGEDLAFAGLTQFFELSLIVNVEDDDTWEDIGTSGTVHIYVDEDTMQNGYEADALPEGELIFDSNGIQLYFLDLENDGWDDGDGYANFVLVNNSGHDLWMYTDDTSYNGWMVSDSFSTSLPDGFWKIARLYVTGYEDAGLESYEEVTDLEFTIVCKDNNSWEQICDDATITLSVTPIPR